MDWSKENAWEQQWWGNCTNTFIEECKQYHYSHNMGLTWEANGFIDLKGKYVLDIGGGPVSLLLKTYNGTRVVVDPCKFPQWVLDRYELSGILFLPMKGEAISTASSTIFDEIWMYNVLLHVEDPLLVIKIARSISKQMRVVEYINTCIEPGHPHSFTPEWLDLHFGGKGSVEVAPPPITTPIWYGIFKGAHHETV
jgi:hypothetical protein